MLTKELVDVLDEAMKSGAKAFGADDLIARLLTEVDQAKRRSEYRMRLCLAVGIVLLPCAIAVLLLVGLDRVQGLATATGLALAGSVGMAVPLLVHARNKAQSELLLSIGANLPPDDALATFRALLRASRTEK